MTTDRYSYFFWGVAAGAAAGLLFAPKPGLRTRALLGKKAKRAQDLISRQATEVCDDVTKTMERGKAALKRTADGVAEAFETGKRAWTK